MNPGSVRARSTPVSTRASLLRYLSGSLAQMDTTAGFAASVLTCAAVAGNAAIPRCWRVNAFSTPAAVRAARCEGCRPVVVLKATITMPTSPDVPAWFSFAVRDGPMTAAFAETMKLVSAAQSIAVARRNPYLSIFFSSLRQTHRLVVSVLYRLVDRIFPRAVAAVDSVSAPGKYLRRRYSGYRRCLTSLLGRWQSGSRGWARKWPGAAQANTLKSAGASARLPAPARRSRTPRGWA